MTIELRVPGRVQASQMSCWWACMAMVLEYYGRDYTHPWDFSGQFARPWNRPDDGIPDMLYERDIDRALERDPFLADHESHAFYAPYEWYALGLPRNPAAVEHLRDISGFRGFDRPAFGRWTADDVESRLRRYGPYIFFGAWNGFAHAIVCVGLQQQASGAEVVTIDPIRGFATNEPLATFNRRMQRGAHDFFLDGLNPLYFPVRDPVRDIVVDEPARA